MLVKNATVSIPRQDFGGQKRLKEISEDEGLQELCQEFEKKKGVIIGWVPAHWTDQEIVLDVRSEDGKGLSLEVLQSVVDEAQRKITEVREDYWNSRHELRARGIDI